MNHQNPTYLKRRSGIYYFTRRIPSILQQQYKRDRLYVSLKTRNRRKAMAASERISCELEALWSQSQIDSVASLINSLPAMQGGSIMINSKYQMGDVTHGLPLISEALETYIELKGKDKSPNFESSVRRSVTYLIDALGDKPIDLYSRKDALFMRDAFVSRNLSVASIKRNFNNINALTGLVCKELGYPASATFRGLFFREAGVQNQRLPVPDMLRVFLQKECKATDDEARWLLALISDTGMRLSEAIGLAREDISLAGKVPYVTVQPHSWRRLKTIDSKRRIPLIGSALWAAQRLIDSHKSTFAFPSFCNGKLLKSNSVSARLNKWLKLRIGDEYVIHSFRHSLRDRLRSVNCPSEVADAIGGWSVKTVGQSYGVGYNLKSLSIWMKRIENKLED
jgi:integrase